MHNTRWQPLCPVQVIDLHALHRAGAFTEEEATKYITKELETCYAYKTSMVIFHADQLIQIAVASSDAGAGGKNVRGICMSLPHAVTDSH